MFYEETQVQRYFDPYTELTGTMNLLDQFGFGNYSQVTFLMIFAWDMLNYN